MGRGSITWRYIELGLSEYFPQSDHHQSIGGLDTVSFISLLSLMANLPLMCASQSVSIIQSFFLAMTLYPDAQRKAQAEIDAVVGHDRLPTFRDRDKLPYVNALCKELLRWVPAAPFSVLQSFIFFRLCVNSDFAISQPRHTTSCRTTRTSDTRSKREHPSSGTCGQKWSLLPLRRRLTRFKGYAARPGNIRRAYGVCT